MKNPHILERCPKPATRLCKPAASSRSTCLWLTLLAFLALAATLSSCTSIPTDGPEAVYNPVTGYPAVGGHDGLRH